MPKGCYERPELKEKLLSRVVEDQKNGCWEWIGCCSDTGYGSIRHKNKVYNTHKLSWELHCGLVPNGLCVLHKCDNRKCINPEHLFLGTKKDNSRDMVNKGRWKVNNPAFGERQGSSKLKEYEVKKIIEMSLSGKPQREIGVYFGISQRQVGRIVHGESWKHVYGIRDREEKQGELI